MRSHTPNTSSINQAFSHTKRKLHQPRNYRGFQHEEQQHWRLEICIAVACESRRGNTSILWTWNFPQWFLLGPLLNLHNLSADFCFGYEQDAGDDGWLIMTKATQSLFRANFHVKKRKRDYCRPRGWELYIICVTVGRISLLLWTLITTMMMIRNSQLRQLLRIPSWEKTALDAGNMQCYCLVGFLLSQLEVLN